MKKSILTILFIFAASFIFSQTDYYWYKNNKVPLKKNSNKRFLVFENIADSNELKQIIDIPDMHVISFNKDKQYATVFSNQSNLNNIHLLNKSKILYEAPYYFNAQNQEAGLSYYFYIKLFKEADSLILMTICKDNEVQIVRKNKFMPLWHTLKCTKNSKGNALEMANLFYEKGLFKSSLPDFMMENPLMYPVLTCPTNDTYYNNQWGLLNTGQNGWMPGIDINICPAWQITTGNEDVVVGIIDNGLPVPYHPDLTNNIYGYSYDTEYQCYPQVFRGYKSYHCEMIAGVIGAEADNEIGVAGVAPESSMMIISNNFEENPNLIEQLTDGINVAYRDHIVNNVYYSGASVINCSWKVFSQNDLLEDAIDSALIRGRNGLGCVMVFAVGNLNSIVSYPANYNPDIIAVGAISPCAERKNPVSCDGENNWGSNYGNELDVVAPGVKIYSTAGDDYYFNSFNGTSSATPFVAGIAALILSVDPTLTQDEVRDIIEQTARKVGNYNYQTTIGRPNGTWNNEMGYGLVDAYAAVVAACMVHISNITYTTNTTITGCAISADNITVDNNAYLILDADDFTLINGLFEVKPGSQLEIK